MQTYITKTVLGEEAETRTQDFASNSPREDLIDLFAIVEGEAGAPVARMEVSDEAWTTLQGSLVGDWDPETLEARWKAGHRGALWGAEVTANLTGPSLLRLSSKGETADGKSLAVVLTATLPA